LVVDRAQFRRPCAVLYGPGTRVVGFRAVPIRDLSMDTTLNTGRMVVIRVWITWSCSAGTIITSCMRVALRAERIRTVGSYSKTNESSRSISHQDYRVLPPTMTFNNGLIVSSSRRTSTVRPVQLDGMRGREWIGKWRCRRYFDLPGEICPIGTEPLQFELHLLMSQES